MPEVAHIQAARERSVAVETGGHTYRLTYDPNRFTEEARLAYVAGVADKQSIREPLEITPVNVAILGPLGTRWDGSGRAMPSKTGRTATPPCSRGDGGHLGTRPALGTAAAGRGGAIFPARPAAA